MNTLMRRFLKRTIRPVAGVMLLAFAVVSSGECVIGAEMTPEQQACCAAMHDECGQMAVSSSCCASELQGTEGLVATKPTIAFVPVAALLAVLTMPGEPMPTLSGRRPLPDASSAGPPGVPTYLFVSSFRI